MDQDTQAVVEFLGAALQDSGLTQAAFATALGTSPSRLSTYLGGTVRPSGHFCFRADRIGRALGAAARRGLVTPPELSSDINRYLENDEEEWAWRGLLQGRDHLRWCLEHDTLIDAWDARPSGAGPLEWQVLLAALARREFSVAGREAPAWTRLEPLASEWIPDHPFLSPERVRAQTPPWLVQANVFVPERDLRTA